MVSPRSRSGAGALVISVAALGAAACDTNDGRTMREPTSQERAAMPTTTVSSTSTTAPLIPPVETAMPATAPAAFTLTAPWADGGAIPVTYTCDGTSQNPLVTWTAPPAGTVELALVVTDPDADDFVHYAVAGLPPTAGQIGGGLTYAGGREGLNSFGQPGWGAPCPPGSGDTHTYRWTLWALSQQNELPDGFTGDDLVATAFATGFASAQLSGTYTRI